MASAPLRNHPSSPYKHSAIQTRFQELRLLIPLLSVCGEIHHTAEGFRPVQKWVKRQMVSGLNPTLGMVTCG
jgi:hypothetical protein